MPRRLEGEPPTALAVTDAGAAPTPPVYSSSELMAEHVEIGIRHAGVLYRLRRTANGKLILTK